MSTSNLSASGVSVLRLSKFLTTSIKKAKKNRVNARTRREALEADLEITNAMLFLTFLARGGD